MEEMHPEDLIECPYDESHMIRARRMQCHLQACRKHHASGAEIACPFNAAHVINVEERRYHMTRCPDRHKVHSRMVNEVLDKTDNRGCVEKPQYRPIRTFGETWDMQDDGSNRQAHHHWEMPAANLQVKIREEEFEGLNPRQRKQLYLQRKAELAEVSKKQAQSMNIPSLRTPHHDTSKSRSLAISQQQQQQQKKNQPVVPVDIYQGALKGPQGAGVAMGRGRGMGQGVNAPRRPPGRGRGRGRGRGQDQQKNMAAPTPSPQVGHGPSNVPSFGNSGAVDTCFSVGGRGRDLGTMTTTTTTTTENNMQGEATQEKKNLYGPQGIGYSSGMPVSFPGPAEDYAAELADLVWVSSDSEGPEKFADASWVGGGYGESDQTGPIPSFSNLSLDSNPPVGLWSDHMDHVDGGSVAGKVSPKTESIASDYKDCEDFPPNMTEKDLRKRLKAINKKLRQITELETKKKNGLPLDPEQEAKLAKKRVYEGQVIELQNYLSSVGK